MNLSNAGFIVKDKKSKACAERSAMLIYLWPRAQGPVMGVRGRSIPLSYNPLDRTDSRAGGWGF